MAKFLNYVFFAAAFSLAGYSTGTYLARQPVPKADMSPVLSMLGTVQEQVSSLASSRCMTVNTPVLQMSVYSTENLGVRKVPKPTPPVRIEPVPLPVISPPQDLADATEAR